MKLSYSIVYICLIMYLIFVVVVGGGGGGGLLFFPGMKGGSP